jgi:Putative esterase
MSAVLLAVAAAMLGAPASQARADGAGAVAVSDDFSRADGGLGGNWTTVAGTSAPVISGGMVVAGTPGSLNSAYWSADSFGADQYAQAVLPASTGWAQGPGIAVRLSGSTGYVLWYSGGTVSIWRMDGPASWTQLAASDSLAVTGSDVWTLEAVGSTLSGYQNGSLVVRATDSAYDSGSPGVWLYYGGNEVAGWSGGDVGSGSFTVGGSVSGLSGSVVLADNGGDDVTVSADGPFTFPTALSGGAAYAVTVAAQPPGQACAVAGGSGTITTADVTSVAVTCAASGSPPGGSGYSVGGSVSGLTGPVVLADNGGDDTPVSADGSFTFPTMLAAGAAYQVSVQTEPPGESCGVANGSGTIAAAGVTSVTVTCAANATVAASDDFNQANGALGSGWTGMTDGGLTVTSGAVTGTSAAGVSGDIRTAESYPSDQYSQVRLTGNQLTGTQWIGPSVRMQADGSSGYVAAYSWNGGNPEVVLYLRTGTKLSPLGTAYQSGALPAGTTLKLEADGNSLAVLVNGSQRIAVADGTYVGGAPGIMAYGTAQAAHWLGGTQGFEVHYLSTDSSGIATYDVISDYNGSGPQPLRILEPKNPAPGVAHNFLFVLPVFNNVWDDGINTMDSANAQNQYNLTIIEPGFAIAPWYANNPLNPNEQEEAFMVDELVPWVKANLATTGTEQNWLIGFSKSGIGGQDLILKHPDVFSLAASWDFPADMSSYDGEGGDPADSYGTDANFQASYRLTPAFLQAHKATFVSSNRIWIGGYAAFQQDDADYDALLTSEGIAHTTQTPTSMAHEWNSGWVPLALAALYQDSLGLGG